jgi:hypothetical protein
MSRFSSPDAASDGCILEGFPRDYDSTSAIAEYVEHYHRERNHQGLGNTIPFPSSQVGAKSGKVIRKERLGGLLNYYERLAA